MLELRSRSQLSFDLLTVVVPLIVTLLMCASNVLAQTGTTTDLEAGKTSGPGGGQTEGKPAPNGGGGTEGAPGCSPVTECCGQIFVGIAGGGGPVEPGADSAGNQSFLASHVTGGTGLEGIAGCYVAKISFSNKKVPHASDREDFVPWLGTLFTTHGATPCEMSSSLGVECKDETFWVFAAGQEPELRSKCVCNAIQFGGPSLGGNANFHLRDSGPFQNTTLPGKPLIFDSDKSGAQLWDYYHGDPTRRYLEVKHTDGTVARFEPYHDQGTNSDVTTWRFKWVRDPFDNQMDFVYSSSQLVRIDYPSGVSEHWDWAPNWGTAFQAYHRIEVRYSLDPQDPNPTNNPLADLTWGMAFENDSSTPETHFGDPIYRLYYPKRSYLPEPTGLYDESSKVDEAFQVYEFVYDETQGAEHRIIGVKHFLFENPSIALEIGPADARLSSVLDVYAFQYVGASDDRVARQEVVRVGTVQRFAYWPGDGSAAPTRTTGLEPGVTLAGTLVTDADDNSVKYEWDDVSSAPKGCTY